MRWVCTEFQSGSLKEQEHDETGICPTFGEHALQFQSVHLEKYETVGESNGRINPKMPSKVLTWGAASHCFKTDCCHSARMHLLAALDAVKHNEL